MTIRRRHVYGHQDTRQRGSGVSDDTPASISDDVTEAEYMESIDTRPWNQHKQARKKPPLHIQANIECDRIASETTNIAIQARATALLPSTLTMPYPGSRAMLRINNTWITSHYKQHISNARHTRDIQNYCRDKYGWSTSIMEQIYWKGIHNARRRQPLQRRIKESKIMHNWLPVMHQQAKMGAQPVCPACTHPDETFYHLFRCTHKQMVETRTMALTQLMDGGIKLGIPRRIMMCIRDLMISYIEGQPVKMHDTSRTLTDAILSQTEIGIQFIFQGYLSIRWFHAISAVTDRAETKMARLITLIWHTFTDGIWRTRNEIKHKQDNKNSAEEERRIEETLRSFCETY